MIFRSSDSDRSLPQNHKTLTFENISNIIYPKPTLLDPFHVLSTCKDPAKTYIREFSGILLIWRHKFREKAKICRVSFLFSFVLKSGKIWSSMRIPLFKISKTTKFPGISTCFKVSFFNFLHLEKA